MTDIHRPGHPAVREDDVQTVNALVVADPMGGSSGDISENPVT